MRIPLHVDETHDHFDRRSGILDSAQSDAAAAFDHRKIRWRLTNDLTHLEQRAVFAFQHLHLLDHHAGDIRTCAAINLGPLDPSVQGLQRTADLRRNRRDRPPRIITGYNSFLQAIAHPHRMTCAALAQLRSWTL